MIHWPKPHPTLRHLINLRQACPFKTQQKKEEDPMLLVHTFHMTAKMLKSTCPELRDLDSIPE